MELEELKHFCVSHFIFIPTDSTEQDIETAKLWVKFTVDTYRLVALNYELGTKFSTSDYEESEFVIKLASGLADPLCQGHSIGYKALIPNSACEGEEV